MANTAFSPGPGHLFAVDHAVYGCLECLLWRRGIFRLHAVLLQFRLFHIPRFLRQVQFDALAFEFLEILLPRLTDYDALRIKNVLWVFSPLEKKKTTKQ